MSLMNSDEMMMKMYHWEDGGEHGDDEHGDGVQTTEATMLVS